MAKEQSQIKERQRTNLKEPRRYKVIIYNDDFTTMEFVVMILVQVFLKSEEEAQALMMQVHFSPLSSQLIWLFGNWMTNCGFPIHDGARTMGWWPLVATCPSNV